MHIVDSLQKVKANWGCRALYVSLQNNTSPGGSSETVITVLVRQEKSCKPFSWIRSNVWALREAHTWTFLAKLWKCNHHIPHFKLANRWSGWKASRASKRSRSLLCNFILPSKTRKTKQKDFWKIPGGSVCIYQKSAKNQSHDDTRFLFTEKRNDQLKRWHFFCHYILNINQNKKKPPKSGVSQIMCSLYFHMQALLELPEISYAAHPFLHSSGHCGRWFIQHLYDVRV